MYHFQADARSGEGSSGCSTCCCASITAKIGETNMVRIDYAPWSVPIAGRGLTTTTFNIEKITAAPIGVNQRPVVAALLLSTLINTPVSGVVSATDAESNALTYKYLPVYGPRNGRVTMSASGAYTYTPSSSFEGYDSFFFSVADGLGEDVVQEAIIAVGATTAAPTAQRLASHVSTSQQSASVNQSMHFLQFPLQISPTAVVGEVHRITVSQNLMTCDGFIYTHISCYDVLVNKC